MIQCIDKCETPRCIGENPHCETPQSWGCAQCKDGYWKESNDHPCVSCDIIPNCNTCENNIGCSDCNEGYEKVWFDNCGINIHVCRPQTNSSSSLPLPLP